MSIIITGNPGVGKHTVAQELLKNGDHELIDINEVAKKSNHIQHNNDSIEVNVDGLKNDVKSLISKKSLIVGHLAPYVVGESDVSFVIILRKSPYKLLDVYKNREYDRNKIQENVGSEILGIITHDAITEFGNDKTSQIDVTEKTPEEVVKIIQNIIRKENYNDEVAWLSEIKQKDALKKFFDY